MSTLPERISDYMKKTGCKSLSAFAKNAGVPCSTLSDVMKGATKTLSSKNAAKIALYVGITIDEVVSGQTNSINDIENIIPLPKTKNVPLLGTIACGEPILAEQNIEFYLRVEENIKADFALKCKGDSMINARIFDGDIVYIHSQPTVENGEIAAVLIGNEATLKKVHYFQNKIVLSPCNPMYDDLIFANEQLSDVRILGKAIYFVSEIR